MRLILFVATIALLFHPAHAEIRTWTSSDGRTVEGEFVSTDGTSLTMKRQPDGSIFTLPLAKLSAEDQAYAKELAEKPPAAEPAAPLTGKKDFSEIKAGEWMKGEASGLPFRLYADPRMDGDQKYPVVIFLHGIGENGDDNEMQIARTPVKNLAKPNFQEKHPCLILAPQVSKDKHWSNDDRIAAVEALAKLLIANVPCADENRVYLTGFSAGGFGIWDTLKDPPRVYAAYVPTGAAPSDERTKSGSRRVPVYAVIGSNDPSIKQFKQMQEDYSRHNLLKTVILEGKGHTGYGETFADPVFIEWLFSQNKGK